MDTNHDGEEVIGHIRFPISCSLKPWDEDPEEYYIPVEATIIASPDEGVEETAGQLRLVIIKVPEAVGDGVSLYEVFDAYSEALKEVYHAMFDADGRLKQDWQMGYVPSNDILYIESLTLEPKYAGTQLFFQALETVSSMFASQGLVVSWVGVLDLGRYEWTRCGFEYVPGTEIVFRDNTKLRPDQKAD